MSAFDPVPSYRVALPGENARFAIDQPLSPMRNFVEQRAQGALDSFGLGSVLRDFQTPRGLPTQVNPVETGLAGNPLTSGLVAGYETARRFFGAPTTGAAMSQDEWESSPYFRKDIPFDPAMTTDRAAALAAQFDLRAARAHFGQKDMVTTLLGQFMGGSIDPVNFVPIFGPGARVAAAGRFGYIMGHALIGASEGAINTAVFGMLSAPDRARYGDDVSWEAAINNIAIGAIAGGAFGGFGGALESARSVRAMKQEQALRMSTETIRNLQDARGVLNDAVGSVLDTGDVRLTPSSKSVIERIAAEVTDKRIAARALDDETAGVTGDKAGEVVITPSGARVAVRPEVVDASTLVRATGQFQVRDRSANNAASAQQIEEIATNLDPVRLMPNVDGSQGAPIVGPDNMIDSGNGRVAAINRAYDAYPARAEAYRKALTDAGYDVTGMQRPVLIQRRTTPLSDTARAQFNADVNGSTTARMSAVELAAMDRNALDDRTLEVLDDGEITGRNNRAFVARFLGNLPANERLSLVDRDGNLSADGVRRIQNALVAAAYGDVDATALRKFAAATDDNTRSIVGALSDVAGKWLTMRRAVQRAIISPEFDQTPELTEALRRLSGWRDQAAREKRPVNVVIREGLGQGDILSGSIAPPVKLFVRSFYADATMTQAASRETIAADLGRIVDVSLKQGLPDMLGEAYAATKLGVLKSVYNDLAGDVFEASGLSDSTGSLRTPGGEPGPRPSVGSDQGRVGANAGYRTPITAAENVEAVSNLKRTQPARSIDDLVKIAPERQAELDAVAQQVAGPGREWVNPGPKARATLEDKMRRKHYESTSEITDAVRGGFKVKTPEDADAVITALARKFPTVIDEGWQITAAGYFDRKALIQFDDGMIGEVQFWHPDMLDAKMNEGHAIYEQMRGLKPDDPKFIELLNKQRDLYARAVVAASEDWLPVVSRLVDELASGGRPAHGNASSNAASVSGTAESTISATSSTGRQSALEGGRNQPELPLITAGLDSQSKNLGSIPKELLAPTVDMQEAKPEPRPDGLDEAAARVGKPDDLKAIAEQFGVDPKTGDYAERVDIEDMRKQGLITPEDEAELAAADNLVADAEAWAETLRVAAACVTG